MDGTSCFIGLFVAELISIATGQLLNETPHVSCPIAASRIFKFFFLVDRMNHQILFFALFLSFFAFSFFFFLIEIIKCLSEANLT